MNTKILHRHRKGDMYIKCPYCGKVTITHIRGTNFVEGICQNCNKQFKIDKFILSLSQVKDGYFIDFDENNVNLVKKVKIWKSFHYIAANCKTTVTEMYINIAKPITKRIYSYRFVNSRIVKKSFKQKIDTHYNLSSDLVIDLILNEKLNTIIYPIVKKFEDILRQHYSIITPRSNNLCIVHQLLFLNYMVDGLRFVGRFSETLRRRLNRYVKERKLMQPYKLTFNDLAKIILYRGVNYKHFSIKQFRNIIELILLISIFTCKNHLDYLYALSKQVNDFNILKRSILFKIFTRLNVLEAYKRNNLIFNLILCNNNMIKVIQDLSDFTATNIVVFRPFFDNKLFQEYLNAIWSE